MKIIPTKEYNNAFDQLSKNEITLDMLEPLDFVQLRNGNIYFVAYNSNDETYTKGLFSPSVLGCQHYLCRYRYDLKHLYDKDQDIVGILRCANCYKLLEYVFEKKYEKLKDYINQNIGWKKINNNKKEMTIEEIEKELGYEIKIVNKEN